MRLPMSYQISESAKAAMRGWIINGDRSWAIRERIRIQSDTRKVQQQFHPLATLNPPIGTPLKAISPQAPTLP